ncbi:alpha/beta-hydrolase [Dentipellis sp. KUC8613]|nr:alpha/beta-hydrolase [Dentipellis sp. KUC8613]
MTSSPPASASTNPTAKLVRSANGMHIFAEATGNPANPHVVLVPGIGFSGCVFDDFCADQRLLDALYIVRVDPRGCGRSDLAQTEEMHESKQYAEDFEAVVKAFDLRHPVLVGWSYGGTWLTDVAAHLPPFTISGCMLLVGLPYAEELPSEVGLPALLDTFPGLLGSVPAAQRAMVDLMFVDPPAPVLTYAKRLSYYGHRMDGELIRCLAGRVQPREALWAAGRAGLPLYVMYGTADGHQKGNVVPDLLRPHYKNMEVHVIEGGSHALHVDCADELADAMVRFVGRVYGKDYRQGV